jgi:hypothetical protein
MAGYIWLLTSYDSPEAGPDVCMFKHIAGIPCPSCGSTRSIIAFAHGDFGNALYYNPLGLISLSIMILAPLWIAYDVALKKDSLFITYNRIETVLKNRWVASVAITLVLINWMWNISKGM